MPSVPTDYKRLFLRAALWTAQETGSTLFTVLKTLSRSRLAETQSGKTLIGITAAGKVATFGLPSGGVGISPSDAACLTSEMLDTYDESKRLLIARAIPAPTDAQIHDEALALLQPTFEVRSDFSYLSR